MFDLRYHVASLAAVFLALVIGILVGVAMSGKVDDAEIRLEPAPDGHTRATVTIEASPWRLVAEGLRPVPRQALARLHALCQTAADL